MLDGARCPISTALSRAVTHESSGARSVRGLLGANDGPPDIGGWPDRSPPAGTVDGVPRISAFYGIIIAMYFDDHPPPHFHAKYGEYEAQVVIATGELLNGDLPRRARALVKEWTEMHRDELMDDWDRAERQEPMRRINPLP